MVNISGVKSLFFGNHLAEKYCRDWNLEANIKKLRSLLSLHNERSWKSLNSTFEIEIVKQLTHSEYTFKSSSKKHVFKIW